MEWAIKIKEWYDKGLWTADMVQNAVVKGKITAEQAGEIIDNNKN